MELSLQSILDLTASFFRLSIYDLKIIGER